MTNVGNLQPSTSPSGEMGVPRRVSGTNLQGSALCTVGEALLFAECRKA